MQYKVTSTARLAVLIDAENAKPSTVEPVLKEIANYGTAYVKRIYGDWTSPHLSSWKDKLHKFAIQPVQQFRYTSGKNSTDSALIIDAMDLLYTNNFDGFCIISSDSDFTRLACRIRESRLAVYGFGEKKTPEAFVSACERFIFTEILEREADAKNNQDKLEATNLSWKNDQELLKVIKKAYIAIAKKDGWANLGQLGQQLKELSPSFDTKKYGYGKIGKFIQAIDIFEIKDSDIKLRKN